MVHGGLGLQPTLLGRAVGSGLHAAEVGGDRGLGEGADQSRHDEVHAPARVLPTAVEAEEERTVLGEPLQGQAHAAHVVHLEAGRLDVPGVLHLTAGGGLLAAQEVHHGHVVVRAPVRRVHHGPDHAVDATGADLVEPAHEVQRVVLAIAVDARDQVALRRAELHRPLVAGDDVVCVALVLRVVHDGRPARTLPVPPVQNLTGRIGAVVVHHEHVQVDRAPLTQQAQIVDALQDTGDLDLDVVGGEEQIQIHGCLLG